MLFPGQLQAARRIAASLDIQATGTIPSRTYDLNSGDQAVDVTGAFSGTVDTWAVSGGGATISGGTVTIPTTSALTGQAITVTASNSAGDADLTFFVSVRANLDAVSGMAFGLGGLEYNSHQPFLNQAKTGSVWRRGDTPFDGAGNLSSGIDANGYPTAIPGGQTHVSVGFDWTPAEFNAQAGAYVAKWDGDATCAIAGASVTSTAANRIEFTVGTGAAWEFRVSAINSGISNLRIVKASRESLLDAGATFNPDFLQLAIDNDAKQVRFMDWQQINDSDKVSADTPVASSSYVVAGVPASVCVEFANLIGADPWVCVPHQANDTLIDTIATSVRDDMQAGRTAIIEYSNECWNLATFEQGPWLRDQGTAEWSDNSVNAIYSQQVKRATNVATRFNAVFSGQTSRIRHALGVQAGTNTQALMDRAVWEAQEGPTQDPATTFDIIAPASYFGGEFITDTTTRAAILGAGDQPAELLARVLDLATPTSIPAALADLKLDRAIADTNGLDLMAYEGGWHIGHQVGSISDAQAFQTIVESTITQSEGLAISEQYIAMCKTVLDGPAMQFVLDGGWTQYGQWGLYPSPGYAGDQRTAAYAAHRVTPRYYGSDVVPRSAFALADQTGDTDTAVSLDLTDNFSANATTLVSADLPAGLSVSGMTITGTPSEAHTGNVTVRASNGAGTSSDAITLDWTVTGDAPSVTPLTDVRAYYALNSLTEYGGGEGPGADNETSVPEWMGRFASDESRTYRANGEFGFPVQWSLPPTSALGFQVATPGACSGTWASTGNVTHVSLTPDNFSQGTYGINDVHAGGQPNAGASYVSRFLQIIDAWEANSPGGSRVYQVYEGWPFTDPYGATNNMTAQQFTDWQNFALGTYHQWFVDLVAALQAARPALEIELNPVSRVLCEMLQGSTAVASLSASDYFVDSAPHGNQNWYFLAAAITYAQTYRTPPPAGFTAFQDVSTTLTADWTDIAAEIWTRLGLGTPATPDWDVTGGVEQLTITTAPTVTAPAVPTITGGVEQLTITG